MADQQRSFDRKHLDDEIEQLMRINDSDDLAETPDARLIADLRHAHQMDEVDEKSLARVYLRLQAHKHHARTAAHPSESDSPLVLHSSRKGWLSVKSTSDRPIPPTTHTSHTSHTSGKSLQGRLAAIGGIVLVAVLVMSAVWLFNGMRAHNATPSNKGVAHQSTPQLNIHTGKLLCSTTYDKNWAIFLARPTLSWSVTGTLAEQHGSLRVFDPKTCASESAKWPTDSSGRPAWSPDGKRLLLFAGDTAQVLDAATGQTLATMHAAKSQSSAFVQAAWTPDGTQVVTFTFVSYDSHTISTISIQVWDASTGALIRTVKTASVYSGNATVSPNGKYFAMLSPDKHLQFWDVATGQIISSVASNQQGLPEAAWSPDGAYLAIAEGSTNPPEIPAAVQVFATASAQRVATFQDRDTYAGVVDALAWSPDGRYLAEGGHAINIWDMKTQKLAATFGKINPDATTTNGVQTAYWVAGLAWSPDGHTLASVTGGETLPPNAGGPDQRDTLNVWQLS